MLREVTDRIKLVVLREDLNLLAVHFDRGSRGLEATAMDLVENLL